MSSPGRAWRLLGVLLALAAAGASLAFCAAAVAAHDATPPTQRLRWQEGYHERVHRQAWELEQRGQAGRE